MLNSRNWFHTRPKGQGARRPFRLENLEDRVTPATFEVQGTILYVNGTEFVDNFTFIGQNDFHTVIVNTPSTASTEVQVIDRTQITAVIIDGKGDFDNATLLGNAGQDTAILTPKGGTLTNSAYFVSLGAVEGITVDAGGLNDPVNDTAIFQDSTDPALIDTFIGSPTNSAPNSSQMFRDDPGNNYRNVANGFRTVQAFSHGGPDVAVLNDSASNDTFTSVGAEKYAEMHDTSNSYTISASNFPTVVANASAGVGQDNQAFLIDSAADDRYDATANNGVLQGGGFLASANNFNATSALFIRGGTDLANFVGTAEDENFFANQWEASLSRGGVIKSQSGAENVSVDMTSGGTDTAFLYDTTAFFDLFSTTANGGSLTNFSGNSISYVGFDVVNLQGIFGGINIAFISAPFVTPAAYTLNIGGFLTI